jgi:hypothetical protein
LIVGQHPATPVYFLEFDGHIGLDALLVARAAVPDAGPAPGGGGIGIDDVTGVVAGQVFTIVTETNDLFVVPPILAAPGGGIVRTAGPKNGKHQGHGHTSEFNSPAHGLTPFSALRLKKHLLEYFGNYIINFNIWGKETF